MHMHEMVVYFRFRSSTFIVVFVCCLFIEFVCCSKKRGLLEKLESEKIMFPVSSSAFDATVTEADTSTSAAAAHPGQSKNMTQMDKIKKSMIRGSESAVTITKMAYLKKEMCKSEPLQQVIREPGCNRRKIVNRFCYGQCNSFFIPKAGMRGVSSGATLESTAFKSCSFCRPKKIDWVTVILQCPHLTPNYKRKRIQVVKQCTCTALAFD